MKANALLDKEEPAMDVKEAAKIAAAYTVDMETLMSPNDKALFKTQSGFAIESTRFLDGEDAWEIGVGFVRERDKARNTGLAALNATEPARDVRTYKTVKIADDSGEVVAYG